MGEETKAARSPDSKKDKEKDITSSTEIALSFDDGSEGVLVRDLEQPPPNVTERVSFLKTPYKIVRTLPSTFSLHGGGMTPGAWKNFCDKIDEKVTILNRIGCYRTLNVIIIVWLTISVIAGFWRHRNCQSVADYWGPRYEFRCNDDVMILYYVMIPCILASFLYVVQIKFMWAKRLFPQVEKICTETTRDHPGVTVSLEHDGIAKNNPDTWYIKVTLGNVVEPVRMASERDWKNASTVEKGNRIYE